MVVARPFPLMWAAASLFEDDVGMSQHVLLVPEQRLGSKWSM